MEYIIYLSFALSSLSPLLASEQPNKLQNAIKAGKIVDVVEILESQQQHKTKKKDLLDLVNKEVEQRKQATQSIFKSSGDLISMGKASITACLGYQLIQAGRFCSTLLSDQVKIPGFPVVITQKNLIWLANSAAGMLVNVDRVFIKEPKDKPLIKQKTQYIAEKLPVVIPVVSVGLQVIGGCIILKSAKNFADAVQKKDAHDKLKKARAIASYIEKIS